MTCESFKSRVRENSGGVPILVVDHFETVHDLRAFMRAAKLYADWRLIKIVLAMRLERSRARCWTIHRKAVQLCVLRCLLSLPVTVIAYHSA